MAAALGSLYYARKTVLDAREGRREEATAHREEVERSAEAAREAEAARREDRDHAEKARQEAEAAHAEEMGAREAALERELWLARMAQLGRVVDLLGETADLARAEITNPPAAIHGAVGNWSRLPGALGRIAAGLILLEQQGSPDLKEIRQQVDFLRGGGIPPERVVSDLMGVLGKVEWMAENDARFEDPRPPLEGDPRPA